MRYLVALIILLYAATAGADDIGFGNLFIYSNNPRTSLRADCASAGLTTTLTSHEAAPEHKRHPSECAILSVRGVDIRTFPNLNNSVAQAAIDATTSYVPTPVATPTTQALSYGWTIETTAGAFTVRHNGVARSIITTS
jgi:hypothetical protein